MESIERKIENYAVVFNVNLLRATLVEATEFRDLLEETIAENDKDIIVNLSACEHLDSTFLGVLVSSYKRLKSQNRTLVIIEPIEQSSIFLTLNSIGKIFPLYTSVKVALEDIENKKLIEKELNELGEAQSHRHERLSKTTVPVESNPFVESPLQQKQEEVQNFESNTNEIIDQPSTETIETTELISETSADFTLVESSEDEEVLKADTIKINSLPQKVLTPEQELETSTFRQEEFNENNFVSETQEVIRPDKHFHTGKVEWEFGFSS
ncbi:MAG: STAS domain-containing protein [bacterium]|nr:STAS domain-containing protein [bacterium]